MTAAPSDADDVLIVGGGIGGLATALALAREGRRVRVLEPAPASEIAPACSSRPTQDLHPRPVQHPGAGHRRRRAAGTAGCCSATPSPGGN